MATPTSAAQIEYMMAAFRQQQDDTLETMRRVYFPALIDLIFKRVFLRRPLTDDMMQMCVDLDIDVPTRNFTSPDGLTFIWR